MLTIIETADGSHTLLNEELKETFHSIHGAIQESQHVFIHHGLHYFCSNPTIKNIKILEVGFGTGLNALLTYNDDATSHVIKHYDTVELAPLDISTVEKLNYTLVLGRKELQFKFLEMHRCPWDSTYSLNPEFTIHKIRDDIRHTSLADNCYDIVYFDAFAPAKQPELWSIEVLSKIHLALKLGGILVTYSAKGELRRNLLSLNMNIERLKGPPGKTHMIRAIKGK